MVEDFLPNVMSLIFKFDIDSFRLSGVSMRATASPTGYIGRLIGSIKFYKLCNFESQIL